MSHYVGASSEAELVRRATDDQFYAMYPERHGHRLDPRDPADRALILVWNDLYRQTAARAQSLSLAGDTSIGHVLPFLLGLPLGGVAGYFLRRWQEEHPGQALPGVLQGLLRAPVIPTPSTQTAGAYVGQLSVARPIKAAHDIVSSPNWPETRSMVRLAIDASLDNDAIVDQIAKFVLQYLVRQGYAREDVVGLLSRSDWPKIKAHLRGAWHASVNMDALIDSVARPLYLYLQQHGMQDTSVQGYPWLDLEQAPPYVGGPWLDIAAPYVGGPWLDIESTHVGAGYGLQHPHGHHGRHGAPGPVTSPEHLDAPDPWASTRSGPVTSPSQRDPWASTRPGPVTSPSQVDPWASTSQLSPQQLLYQLADVLFWQRTGYKPGQKLDPADAEDAQMMPAWQQAYASVVATQPPPSVSGPWLDIEPILPYGADIGSAYDAASVGADVTDLDRVTDVLFWHQTHYKTGQRLDPHDPADRAMLPVWLEIRAHVAETLPPQVSGTSPYERPYRVESEADRRRRWPQVKALIEAAKREAVESNASYPAAAWVWALDPSGASLGDTVVTPFASYAQALDYMRSRIQTPHVALALFDTASAHWPNPVNWTKSNDPAYESIIAQRVAASPRVAGGTTIGSVVDDVRKKAEDLAARRAGDVIGVIHTSKDDLWHVLAFRGSDDADDWLNTATQDPAAYTYAACFDKRLDRPRHAPPHDWPHAYIEKISGMRASPGTEVPRCWAASVGWHHRPHGWPASVGWHHRPRGWAA